MLNALISIHAPHEGERRLSTISYYFLTEFQSTLPTRGSDDKLLVHVRLCLEFQSTLPTRGSDFTMFAYPAVYCIFQSTLPTRGSDVLRCGILPSSPRISIHAPHEGERPDNHKRESVYGTHFNPRSPRGGATLSMRWLMAARKIFQSTLPTRGSDENRWHTRAERTDFNPRSPRGGATLWGWVK